jgi:hypothetical protein
MDTDQLVIAVVNGQPSGYPLTYSNFQLLFPQTSFPDHPTMGTVAPFGYAPYVNAPMPTPGPLEQVEFGTPTWNATTEVYEAVWNVVPMSPADQQAATNAATSTLRLQRNSKLTACDWTQLPDVTLTPTEVANWRVYRQQLRDYMAQVTNPFAPPAWPVPPS